MEIGFTNGKVEVKHTIESNYVSSVFNATQIFIENEGFHQYENETALWNASRLALIELCNLHARKIMESLNLDDSWDWDFL